MQNSQEEKGLPIAQYWTILCNRRWWLILALVGVWGSVTAVSWFLPPKYQSQALVLVEQQQVPKTYVEPNVTVDVRQRLDTMTQQILSRTRLTSIISTYHLYSNKQNSLDPDALVDLMRKDIDIQLVVSPGGKRDELTGFTISYTGATAALAQQVTGQLTSLFIEENLRSREQQAVDTTAFLQNQLDQAAKDLATQEQRLRDFKTHNLGELPEQLQSNLQILGGLQGRLQAATDALSRAQQQGLYLQSLQSQYRGLDSVATAGGDTSLSPAALDARLTQLRQELAQLLSKYTERHPDVVRVKEDIASTEQLKKKIEAEMKAQSSDPKASATVSGAPNTQMTAGMQIASQLKANEFEIANRRKEIKDIESQISQYQSRLNLTPVREQELAGIVRDHEQSLANYTSLLAKKQQSELATNLEKRQQGEQFRVIDPASLPIAPSFPNRLKFSLAGIAAGLALGLGLVVLRELVDTRIYTEQMVKSLTRAPVLTTVPGLWTIGEHRRQHQSEWLQRIAATVLLALIPVGTLLAFLHG